MTEARFGVRPAVAAMGAYVPGRNPRQAEADHGVRDAVKLASNENPYPPIPAVASAIAVAASGVNRYGDPGASELRERLAGHLGVDIERVAVGCGSVGLLQQLCLALLDPGDEVVTPWLSFEAYPILVQTMGATLVRTPLRDHAADLDAVAAAVGERTKMVMLATPNNPTGTALSTAEIETLLYRIGDGVLVVVDEAYREFADPGLGDPVHDLASRYANVVVTRTFSKAYSMAGLRVGYMAADPEVVAAAQKVLLPFSVNAAAQAAALAVLEHLDEAQPVIDTLIAERGRVLGAVRGLGVNAPDSEGNFVWLPLGAQAAEVGLAMERLGVIARVFAGDGIRATIGTPAENDRFLAALAASLPG